MTRKEKIGFYSIGIKISKRKSKDFPYGLYKVENFVSLRRFRRIYKKTKASKWIA